MQKNRAIDALTKDAADSGLIPLLRDLSSPFTGDHKPVAIVLAAGQGKRIKSHRSKMLHKIWGVPTVVRVVRAAAEGLESPNQVIVVGIKAKEVAEALGRAEGRRYAYQAEQRGTGHAVRTAVDAFGAERVERDVYVFPGDMGLIDLPTVRAFREAFAASGANMMVMAGTFSGSPEENYYGRILRVPEQDDAGQSSGALKGAIMQIVEFKDILALDPKTPFPVVFRGRRYSFSRAELLALREYNSGLYAFQGRHLAELIGKLGYENVQGEMYLTDLIHLFNQAGLIVAGAPPLREETLLGFNDKAVLHQMHRLARRDVFEKLNKIIAFADQDDFFIDEDVVEHLLEIDRAGAAADIVVGEGVFLGRGVRLSEGVRVARNARLEGDIRLGQGVFIGESVHISSFAHQTVRIGAGTRILKDGVLRGNITVGADCLIESPVRLTGSDEHPLVLGERVRIKGDSYLYGSVVADDCVIVNCVLRRSRVACRRDGRGDVIPVCYVFPEPTGRECISPL